MKIKSWMGYYVGDEFPEYYGREIEISDCHKDKNNPCYQILFVGEHYWHDNMDDSDWQVLQPGKLTIFDQKLPDTILNISDEKLIDKLEKSIKANNNFKPKV